MGRFSRSWELVEQSFAILWADKQLMLFPVLSGISCVIVIAAAGVERACGVFACVAGGRNQSAQFSAFFEVAGICGGDVCAVSG